MEFRHLQSFLAIAQELHFGRAAAKLHLTQPSLSQQLQRLERTLGVELVARSSHEVRLTPAGRAFQDEARAIVAQVEQAIQSVRQAAAGRTGTVRVGYNFPAGQHILPTTLARMHTEVPDVAVKLVELHSGPQLAALAAGELDVALVYGAPVTSGFAYKQLLRLPMVAVVGPDHAWADRSSVPVAELAGQPCILFAREHCPAMHDTILSAAERAGIRLTIARMVDDPGALGILIQVKRLVGFASASRAMFAAAAVGGVRPIPVALYEPLPTIDLYAVWRDGECDGPRAAVLDCLESAGPFQVPPLPR